ncbi:MULTISPECIES: retropepsin-like aspartic protease family protein [Alkalimonas]|uniref:TIGR02281 family clan AA aspartic protease n=1 Tax=Alkalimonas mucilaginosa TaxID=3057676 RepID=A0ABU7JDQ6_9GAMM|nr:TIGR02281 family clan AA aspartic protease [Alkalimonas sp. MEB004]MEE2023168.1 TIGR02281 family clan AA aspartic protease [Alkalimonas sp. MEB004]
MTDKQPTESTEFIGKSFTVIAWLLLLGLLVWWFQGYLHHQNNPNQQLHSIQGVQGETRTTLVRNRSGHYVGTALINGLPADFMLDTGATTVAVSEQAARRLGLRKGQRIQVMTANGIADAWRSQIDELQLGDIRLHQVDASIVPNLGGTEILLGMSALNQLEFNQQANQLTLIQR